MRKALVTGAGGFVGSHLIEYLLKEGINVTAVLHPKNELSNLKNVANKIEIIRTDLTNKIAARKLATKKTDYVFHLAAFSSPPESFKNPQRTIKNNVFAQLYLLQALSEKKSNAKILIVGSADEYGMVDKKNVPVNEETPLVPTSPYAISKVAQDLLGYQFFLSYGLKIIRVRPFNHIGPRQSTNFVVPSFASQIANIEKKGNGELRVGNLNSYRDFTDVRDIVRAYLLSLEKGKYGEVYNIGSGKSYLISDILDKLLSFSKAKIKIIKDDKKYRAEENFEVYCDYSKFKKDTNWQPRINIERTLFDTIEYERSLLK